MNPLKLLIQNRAMQLTVISSVLIVLGLILEHNQLTGVAIVAYLTAFLVGGWNKAVEGIQDTIENKRLNVDVLMIIAAVGAAVIGYWMEGALLIFIFSLSGSLEEFAMERSTEAITGLMQLQPTSAKRYSATGQWEEVAVEELQVGDRLLVAKGANVPTDGTIEKGTGLFDEANLTGESIPVTRVFGDEVFGGTTNVGEAVTMIVSKPAEQTVFASIVRLVQQAQATPSKTASLIERIEDKYVKVVLLFVPIMIVIFAIGFNWGWQTAFYRGMVLLTVVSPCALIASATPAILAGLSNGARHGILFKGGSFLENFAQIDAIVFDKTGTITHGKPEVVEWFIEPTFFEEAQAIVCQIEQSSTHPLAIAIVNFIQAQKTSVHVEIEQLIEQPGFGVEALVDGVCWRVGKRAWMQGGAMANGVSWNTIEAIENEGKTLLFIERDNVVVGYYALLDQAKEDAKPMIDFFKQQGVKTILLTGDTQATGETIADQLGIEQVQGNCLPEDKAKRILSLREQYPMIAMVGDGINDAPALANATIGIAMGQGTDIAMEVSDIVLMKNDLQALVYCYRLSQKLNRITKQNIIFSLSVIALLVLANIGQAITLPFGVIGHEGSTILVILNGLRLLKEVGDAQNGAFKK